MRCHRKRHLIVEETTARRRILSSAVLCAPVDVLAIAVGIADVGSGNGRVHDVTTAKNHAGDCSVTRRFVDTRRPMAQEAARLLIEHSHSDVPGIADLSRWLIVVPGSRAGRLLMHAILREAAGRGLACEMPTFATIGRLLERAFAPLATAEGNLAARLEIASPLERTLAWEAVLQEHAAGQAAPFVPRGHVADPALWRRLARGIARLEDDLDAAGRTFADAARSVETMQGDPTRLLALEALSAEVAVRLDAAGLILPRKARERILAKATLAFESLALVGTLDLAPMQRCAIRRFPSVLAIVAGREELADRFDELGAANDRWNESEIDIPEESIVTAESPRDAAESALNFIADRVAVQPELACDEITIGLGDAESAAELALAARDAGVDVHAAAGEPLLASPVGRVLTDAAAYRASRSVEDLAALIRRPPVELLVRGDLDLDSADPIAALDAVRMACLPSSLDSLPDSDVPGDDLDIVRRSIASIDRWLGRLASGAEATEAALGELTKAGAKGGDAAIEAIATALAGVDAVHPTLRGSADRLELAMELADGIRLPVEPRERAVEAIGWLELLFEPAPHVVVLGMNEGLVPGGGGQDGLVPESVRELLGMTTRRGRAARDAALLDVLVARSRSLQFVVMRRTEEGDPLTPSRLLLRCRGQALARRVERLADPAQALSGKRAWRPRADGRSGFVVPAPGEEAREIASMGVTAFRDFLACPMRFWLGRIERLEAVEDDLDEIAVPDLGTVVHATMRWFAQESGLAACTDADAIALAIDRAFVARARETYGAKPLPAVRLQLDIMRRRLEPFARWQARHAADGWTIHSSEIWLPKTFAISPKGLTPMHIRGQIDRIDHHAATKRYRIIDYKTGDAGKSPREAHRRGKNGTGEWFDLQLPLYLLGMRSMLGGVDAKIETGYVRLPSDPSRCGWVSAGFSNEEIDEAKAVATAVVERIRSGEFTLGDPIGWDDPFEGILQRQVFGGDDGSRREMVEAREGGES